MRAKMHCWIDRACVPDSKHAVDLSISHFFYGETGVSSVTADVCKIEACSSGN